MTLRYGREKKLIFTKILTKIYETGLTKCIKKPVSSIYIFSAGTGPKKTEKCCKFWVKEVL